MATKTPIMASNESPEHPTAMEDSNLQNNPHHLLLKRHMADHSWSDVVDSSIFSMNPYTVGYYEILGTVVSMLGRTYAVYINIRLAYDYYKNGNQEYGNWTSVCIITPMFVTSLILANMCYQDSKLKSGIFNSFRIVLLEALTSFLFRYWKVLIYSIKCKRAERNGRKEDQIKYHKMTIREESDVAFIRIFECFLETAPQKILLISIILRQEFKLHTVQILSLSMYFFGMAWCLAVYHRSSRYAQIDKHNIKWQGFVLQLCWHLCTSVARTICIALVASVFPIWTVIACSLHAILSGLVTFIVERPEFAETPFSNFLFTLVLGFVYLFTYVPVRDAPTFRKYCLYYTVCSFEILVCIHIFAVQMPSNHVFTLNAVFHTLCIIPVAFYIAGIAFMILYYSFYHPHITARKSKRFVNDCAQKQVPVGD